MLLITTYAPDHFPSRAIGDGASMITSWIDFVKGTPATRIPDEEFKAKMLEFTDTQDCLVEDKEEEDRFPKAAKLVRVFICLDMGKHLFTLCFLFSCSRKENS